MITEWKKGEPLRDAITADRLNALAVAARRGVASVGPGLKATPAPGTDGVILSLLGQKGKLPPSLASAQFNVPYNGLSVPTAVEIGGFQTNDHEAFDATTTAAQISRPGWYLCVWAGSVEADPWDSTLTGSATTLVTLYVDGCAGAYVRCGIGAVPNYELNTTVATVLTDLTGGTASVIATASLGTPSSTPDKGPHPIAMAFLVEARLEDGSIELYDTVGTNFGNELSITGDFTNTGEDCVVTFAGNLAIIPL